MYVRVKRQKTTYFVHCESSETVLQLKGKIQAITNQDAARVMLKNAKDVDLTDAETLQQQQIDNDAELHMIFKTDDDSWEPVEVQRPEYQVSEAEDAQAH